MSPPGIPITKHPHQGVNTKKKRALYWGCGCAVMVVIIVIIAVSFGGFYLYRIFRGPTDVIKAHYQALEEKNYTKAYSCFSYRFQKKHSLGDYIKIVKQHPEIFQIERSSFRSINIKNNNASIAAKLWTKKGDINFIQFSLQREKGEWKIDDFNLIEKDDEKGVKI